MTTDFSFAMATGIERDALTRLQLVKTVQRFTDEELKQFAELLRRKSGLAEAQSEIAEARLDNLSLNSMSLQLFSNPATDAYNRANWALNWCIETTEKLLKLVPLPVPIEKFLALAEQADKFDRMKELMELRLEFDQHPAHIDDLLELANSIKD